ncbi:MAG: hypothetical protein JWQ35_1126 [Bacteriovoracaceae bacterium]|nr:hypothetical protein [Bacteriovoracaceae bacterium]
MKLSRKRINHETELNLVPMLDLFLSLIPFLLMSSVLVSFGGVYVEAPSYSKAEAQKIENKNDELDLAVQIEKGRVSILGYKKGFETKIEAVKGSFDLKDLNGLRSFLTGLQQHYSKIHSSLFHASAETRYQDAVSVLNILRATQVSENLVLAVGAVE